MITYKAFGLILASDTEIAQLRPVGSGLPADVTIAKGDLTYYSENLPQDIHCLFRTGVLYFEMPGVGDFLIENGSKIIYSPAQDVSMELLSAYFMGPCMGGVLHQRGVHPLHCSCVADDRHVVMICGDSGAGKSTLASEFLKNGWKLMTDDVAAVSDVQSAPIVHPSYPSQKLWQDSLDRYEHEESSIHSLYGRTEGVKYGVDVSKLFLEEARPLSLIVRLVPEDGACSIRPITGMAKVDQLMKNTYNAFMVLPEDRQKFFQRCVTLSSKVPMLLATRETRGHSAAKLVEMITSYLEEC